MTEEERSPRIILYPDEFRNDGWEAAVQDADIYANGNGRDQLTAVMELAKYLVVELKAAYKTLEKNYERYEPFEKLIDKASKKSGSQATD